MGSARTRCSGSGRPGSCGRGRSTHTFKLSNDPNFEAKLVDVVGLYLDPPERAVVFSLDEKTQCQALDRTQPSLPLKPGRGRTMTHDYKRSGTVNLFAAMNVATGLVGAQFRTGAHMARPPETGSLASALHPTSASWLNLIEGWFSVLTRKALTNASFISTRQLEIAIDVWASQRNHDPQPFVWTKTVDDITTKVKRGPATLDRLTESATHHEDGRGKQQRFVAGQGRDGDQFQANDEVL
jgi:hypothetical protein